MAASASFMRASASSTVARAGGISSGRGAETSLWSWAFDEASSASRTSSCALKSRSSVRNSGAPALTFSPFLTKTSVTTPGTLTPIGMFSRRASTSPDPAIIETRSGRVGGSTIGLRRRRDLLRLDHRVDRENHAGHRQQRQHILGEHGSNDLRDGESRTCDRTGRLTRLDDLLIEADDPAVVHVGDPLAELEDAVVVGHDDDGPVGPDGRLA